MGGGGTGVGLPTCNPASKLLYFVFRPLVLGVKGVEKGPTFSKTRRSRARRGLKPSRRCPPPRSCPREQRVAGRPRFPRPKLGKAPAPSSPSRGRWDSVRKSVKKCFTGGQGEEAQRRGREQKLAEDTRRTAGHVFDREPAAQRGGRLQTTAPHVLSGSGASTAIFHGIQARGCRGGARGTKGREAKGTPAGLVTAPLPLSTPGRGAGHPALSRHPITTTFFTFHLDREDRADRRTPHAPTQVSLPSPDVAFPP